MDFTTLSARDLAIIITAATIVVGVADLLDHLAITNDLAQ